MSTGIGIVTLIIFVVVVVGLARYSKNSEKERRNKLSQIERLWEDFEKLNSLSPAWETVARRIEACLLEDISAAATASELSKVKLGFIDGRYSRELFWSRPGTSLQKVFLEMLDAFAEKEKLEADEQKKKLEEILLVKIIDVNTAVEAMKICHECPDGDVKSKARKKWDGIALQDVLNAKTLEELRVAKNNANLGSLAGRFVPFMHEMISKRMLERADSVDDIVEIAETSTGDTFPHNTALYIAFLKLHARYQHNL